MPEWPEARLLSFPGGWIAQDLPFGRSTAMRREIAESSRCSWLALEERVNRSATGIFRPASPVSLNPI